MASYVDSKILQPVKTLGKIAQTISLALSRFHLVVPSMFAFTFGELTLAQRPLEYTDHYPSRNTLYMRAQDKDAYIHETPFWESFCTAFSRCVVLFLRALYLAILFSPCIVMAPFTDTFGHRFKNLCFRLFMDQWAATRQNLFARDLCTKLAELHTKALEHSFHTKKKLLKNNLYPGQQVKPVVVAIKVRHPGVGESIRMDFFIINLVAKISSFIPTLRWLRLDENVQQFAVFMMSQVDLARETAHLSRFIYNFCRWKDVSFPKLVFPLVHPVVLVESYEHGESVSHYVDDLEG
ncbi:hypothetical protein AAG906_026328 [Vitis piasezkii]